MGTYISYAKVHPDTVSYRNMEESLETVKGIIDLLRLIWALHQNIQSKSHDCLIKVGNLVRKNEISTLSM